MSRRQWFYKHWKLGVHLVLRTKYFGVNNERWSCFESIFGQPTLKILRDIVLVKPLLHNYKNMKFRAGVCHFLTDEQYRICFGTNKPKQ